MSRDKKINSILFYTSKNKSLKFLRYRKYFLENDIYRIASLIFNIEVIIKSGLAITNNIEIQISNESYHIWDIKKICSIISDILQYVLFKKIKIKLIPANLQKFKRNIEIDFPKFDNICLFSGGVDSLSGILNASKYYNKNIVGLFIAHGDLAWNVNIVEKLKKNINLKLFTMHAPKMRVGYSQLRGLLYLLFSATYASVLKSKRIIISECGPTMYQNQFAPFDEITMTTHPYILQRAKELIRLFLNKDIELITPFEDLTKAEVIKLCPDKNLLPITHSCVSLRYGSHEGACYGCIIRKLGFIVSNIPDTYYNKNPLINQNDDSNNILSLLRFSCDILTDYSKMDYYMKENIIDYDKYDLFKRFALDNISAIYLLKKSNKIINPSIIPLYKYVINNIGENVLLKRIETISAINFNPNFNKKV